MSNIIGKKQHGFTLIELLLALTFFSFLLVFATASFIRINRSFVRGANVKLVQEEARKVTEEISSALRNSNGASIERIDNDDMSYCDPRGTAVNVNEPGTVSVAAADIVPTGIKSDCRHRLCIGSTVFAWNQATMEPDIDEHSWYHVNPPTLPGVWFAYDSRAPDTRGDPFSVIKTTRLNTDPCVKNINYSIATALVDNTRVIVQDIDVYLVNPAVADTYMVRVSLSTKDADYTDNMDLFYEPLGLVGEENPAIREFKAERCQTDTGSQAFCYVETLSTIVTIR